MQFLKEGLLKVDPGLLLWTIITFIVLVLILWKAAWRPIIDALDARSEKVRGDIDSAERAREEIEKILAEHKEMMDNAKNEASKIIAKGKDEALNLKYEIMNKANSDAEEIIDRARREIELARDRALADIKSEIVMLSTEIASKIISKNINPDDQKALVERALDEIRVVM